MKNRDAYVVSMLAVMISVVSAGHAALSTRDAVAAVADRLVSTQITLGRADAGSWEDEQAFTGSIVAGLAMHIR